MKNRSGRTVQYNKFFKGGNRMQFKLVIYTSTKVIYMSVSGDELDSIYNQYSDSNIFILNNYQN